MPGIQVTVHQAMNIPKADSVGKTDPYVKVSVGGVTQQTTVKKNAGDVAQWNETFSFNMLPDRLEIELWDKDKIGKDDKLAIGSINVMKKHPGFHWNGWVDLAPIKASKGKNPTVQLVYTLQ